MTNEQYQKHQILKQYNALREAREKATIDYCSALTKLTRVTQNISPLPGGHGSESTYDERVFELVEKHKKIRDINNHLMSINYSIINLSNKLECFVIGEFYIRNRKISDIACILGKSKRTIFRIRNEALDHITFYKIEV